MKKEWIVFGVFIFSIALFPEILFSSARIQKKPLCYRNSCANKDANNKGCDYDTERIIEEEFKETKIELRYSAKCDASWSRAIVPPGSLLYVKDSQGNKYGDNYVVPDDKVSGAHYGNMGPGRKLRACVKLPDNRHLCTKLADQE